MVLGHIRTWYKDYWLAYETELWNAAGSSAADNQVGSLVSGAHIGDEIGNHQIRDILSLQSLCNLGAIVFACLPDKLGISCLYQVEVLQHALVDGAGAKATTYQQNGFLGRIETKGLDGILARNLCVEQSLTYGISCKDNLVGREETLHSLVSHTDLGGFLGQQLVGNTCVWVLLLNQAGDTHGGSLVKGRTAGITANTYSYLRLKILDNLLGHTLALPYLVQNLKVLE